MKANEIGIKNAIDELYRLREERKISMEKEEQLSDSIKHYMREEGLESIETNEHCALLSVRAGGTVSPEALLEILDGNLDKFCAIVSVRKTGDKKKGTKGADYFVSKEELESITEYSEVVALKISKIALAPEEAKPKVAQKPRKVKFA